MFLALAFIIGLIFVPYLAWLFFIVNSANLNEFKGEGVKDFMRQQSEKKDVVMQLSVKIVIWTTFIYIAMWIIGYFVNDESKWYFLAATQVLLVIVWKRLIIRITRNQIYIIGGSEPEFNKIKEALIQQTKKEILINISHISIDLENVQFPRATNNAIICTSDSIEKFTPKAIDFLRVVAEKSTCRIFLYFTKDRYHRNISLFDDFIQRINDDNINVIAENVIEFLKKGNTLAQTENLLGARDTICIIAYNILKWFWTLSYIVATLHIINTSYLYFTKNTAPWDKVFLYTNIVTAGTFFGLFFCTHAIITITRNFILAISIFKRVNLELVIGVILYLLAIGLVLHSILEIDKSFSRILIFTVLSIFAYWFYMYSFRIRAECSSLSEMHSLNSDLHKREDFATSIGCIPFPTGAFPLIANTTGVIFISYMHKSMWASNLATELEKQFDELNKLFSIKNSQKKSTANKYETFRDRSSIPPAGLWRRYLLRAISECTYFVAFLDDQYLDLEWVFAESAYAAMLRKNVAKPIILLVFKSQESMFKIKNSAYGDLYKDIFEIPENFQLGAGILIAENEKPLLGVVIQALEKIRPMQLLPKFHTQ